MRMYDLIMKKRSAEKLSGEEIRWMVEGFVSGEIPDYQMSAMLMAIWFQGMDDRETAQLTDAMAHSGDMVDLSAIQGVKVDKHSTGGVGDKTTLVIAPIAAACGVKIAKMSGRGLGHTGGTVDKLESIPGFRTALNREEFFEIVNRVGLCVAGQSGNLAPADKKMYALRDVTATVDSIPLIAASIMSKKLAAGSDSILLDVKTGSGAFMKSLEDAIALAKKMTAIGEHAGRRMAALITDMDIPLGSNIGNSLEVAEAVETLKGAGPADLTEVCLNLAANMLYLADKGNQGECMEMAKRAIEDGSALRKLAQMVEAQGGDPQMIMESGLLKTAPLRFEVKAKQSGYIGQMDTEKCGIASSLLGAGRTAVGDTIDYGAGIILHRKTGDAVKAGEVLAELLASKEELFADAAAVFEDAVHITQEKPESHPLIYARIEGQQVFKTGETIGQ